MTFGITRRRPVLPAFPGVFTDQLAPIVRNGQSGLGPFHLFRWAFAARFLLPQLKGAGGISEWAESCPEEETVSQNDMS
jgi:hypothetical protein